MMVSYAILSEGSKLKHIQLRFPALLYMYCYCSGFSESFYNITCGSWWKTYISCDFALQMWFLICLTLLSWNLPQSDEPWSSFACKAWDAPFIPKQDTLTYYQFTWYWELFQNRLKWIFYNLFTFIWPLSQLFWIVLQPSQSKFAHIYKIHLRWSLYFCQLNKS